MVSAKLEREIKISKQPIPKRLKLEQPQEVRLNEILIMEQLSFEITFEILQSLYICFYEYAMGQIKPQLSVSILLALLQSLN